MTEFGFSPTKGVQAGALTDPLQFLVACHDQIEEHLRILEGVPANLRSPSTEKRKEAKETLDQALAFLKTMGELHTEDEELSLFPRLRENLKKDDPFGLLELADLLETQHREKEEAYRELAACVAAFPPHPQPPGADDVRHAEAGIARLVELYRPHIMIENERLIPLSGESLSPDDLAGMKREMQARHKL